MKWNVVYFLNVLFSHEDVYVARITPAKWLDSIFGKHKPLTAAVHPSSSHF